MTRIHAKLIVSKRKDRLKVIGGYHTREQWKRLKLFFNKICPRCEKRVKKFTKDHIIPITWQSSHEFISNYQPLCMKCNLSKSNHSQKDYRPKHVIEWAEKETERLKNE